MIHHPILIAIGSGATSITFLSLAIAKYNTLQFYKKTEYLSDAPFPYKPETDDNDEYIVFNLGDNTTLWCDYNLGIRSDGVYGLNYLKVRGLNGRGSRIKLNIGQSIFPIIEKLDRFQAWMNDKAFQSDWDKDFINEWNDMKKKLDNLRMLETRSKDKEKKGK